MLEVLKENFWNLFEKRFLRPHHYLQYEIMLPNPLHSGSMVHIMADYEFKASYTRAGFTLACGFAVFHPRLQIIVIPLGTEGQGFP